MGMFGGGEKDAYAIRKNEGDPKGRGGGGRKTNGTENEGENGLASLTRT
jgi:hypothetical protein